MNAFQHTGDLYRSHIMPFSVASQMIGKGSKRDETLRISYDGHTRGGESRIFAVIPIVDLDLIGRRIDLPHPPGIGLPGSDMFFMKTADGVSLYIDTDRQEDLFLEILDVAHDMGFNVAERGLAFFHLDGSGLAQTPVRAAFDVNGFENVPIEAGYKLLSEGVSASAYLIIPADRKAMKDDSGHPAP